MSNKKGISQFQAQLTCAVITGQYAAHIVPFSKVTQLMYPSLSCCFLSRQTVKSQLTSMIPKSLSLLMTFCYIQ